MDIAGTPPAPVALRVARHVVGMALVALAHPMVHRSDDPVMTWALAWIGTILLAGALYGLYALFFTSRAASGWPKSAIMLAWVLLLLGMFGAYQSSPPATTPEQGPWLEYQRQ